MEDDKVVRWEAEFTDASGYKVNGEYHLSNVTLPEHVARMVAKGAWNPYTLSNITREGVPWSPEEFRDGAYYKDRFGRTYLVVGEGAKGAGFMAVQMVNSHGGKDGTPCDHRRDNGRFWALEEKDSGWHLVPGEVDRYGEPIVNAILKAGPAGTSSTHAAVPVGTGEPKRPPLDWQADVKSFDPFKGWFTGQDDDLGPTYDHEVKHTGQGTYGDEGSDAGWAGKVAKLPGAWGENEYTGNLKR